MLNHVKLSLFFSKYETWSDFTMTHKWYQNYLHDFVNLDIFSFMIRNCFVLMFMYLCGEPSLSICLVDRFFLEREVDDKHVHSIQHGMYINPSDHTFFEIQLLWSYEVCFQLTIAGNYDFFLNSSGDTQTLYHDGHTQQKLAVHVYLNRNSDRKFKLKCGNVNHKGLRRKTSIIKRLRRSTSL